MLKLANPLKEKYPLGYTFGERTFYFTNHIGTDFICPTGTNLYAVMDGSCYKHWGYQGGKQIWQYSKDRSVLVRYMHLSQYLTTETEWVNAGELLGKTGNTGAFTSAPHLHIDVQVNKSYVDPMKYLYIDNDYLKNMTQEEFNNLMKGYLKKDNRLKQDKDGSVWIVGKGKRFRMPGNQALLASFLVSGWLTDAEKALPVAADQGDVL